MKKTTYAIIIALAIIFAIHISISIYVGNNMMVKIPVNQDIIKTADTVQTDSIL